MSKRTMIVLFNLKDDDNIEKYEAWAKEVDIPIAGGLKSVDEFKVYRSQGLFGSNGKPPYQYIEILHINNFDNLANDIQAEPRMSEVAQQFQNFAENPVFIVTEQLKEWVFFYIKCENHI